MGDNTGHARLTSLSQDSHVKAEHRGVRLQSQRPSGGSGHEDRRVPKFKDKLAVNKRHRWKVTTMPKDVLRLLHVLGMFPHTNMCTSHIHTYIQANISKL